MAKHTDVNCLLLALETFLGFRAANEKSGIVQEMGQTSSLENVYLRLQRSVVRIQTQPVSHLFTSTLDNTKYLFNFLGPKNKPPVASLPPIVVKSTNQKIRSSGVSNSSSPIVARC